MLMSLHNQFFFTKHKLCVNIIIGQLTFVTDQLYIRILSKALQQHLSGLCFETIKTKAYI